MASFDAVRVRLERVLELVQVERPGAALLVAEQMLAIEHEGRRGGLTVFADGAKTAAGLARRWARGATDASDARVGILRLTLAMIRELAQQEGRR